MTDINVCSHPAVSSGSRTLSGARLAARLPGLFQVVSVRRARQTGRPAPPLKRLPSELHINHHHASFFFSWKVCAAIFILKSPYNWKVPTNRSTSSCFPMVPPKLGWEHWNAGRQRPVAWAGPRAGLGAAAGPGAGGRATHAASGLWLPPSQAF